jgi:16S rRNA (adenine1518-N6/adenine1519-N6)-dimethyltransferase
MHGEAKLLFRVPPQVFYPAPRVESVVVGIDRRPASEHAEKAVDLARTAFSKRRKMVRASLAHVHPDIVGVLAEAGVDPASRAEDLSPEEYLRLAEVLS